MGDLASWAPTNPAQVKQFEAALGLPVDGTWDPALAKRVEAYQMILNQTPGQTADNQQYTDLVNLINQRGQAFGQGGDNTPMQDAGFQQFLRNAGAQEADLLSVIQERTLQSQREINRHAAGLQADLADTASQYDRQNQQLQQQQEQGTQKIQQDYSNRGLVGASATQNDIGQLGQRIGLQQADVAGNKAAALGKLSSGGLEWDASNRDALAAANRGTQSDILSLYRQRADQELAARDRLGLKSAQGVYPT